MIHRSSWRTIPVGVPATGTWSCSCTNGWRISWYGVPTASVPFFIAFWNLFTSKLMFSSTKSLKLIHFKRQNFQKSSIIFKVHLERSQREKEQIERCLIGMRFFIEFCNFIMKFRNCKKKKKKKVLRLGFDLKEMSFILLEVFDYVKEGMRPIENFLNSFLYSDTPVI